MHVLYRTLGCKANQYDTERMRQELEALGARRATDPREAGYCVLNTCTVTNQADADARRLIRRLRRQHPRIKIVVAGCSSALKPDVYREMPGVVGVVRGHDPVEVAQTVAAASRALERERLPREGANAPLVPLELRRSLDRMDGEPVGGELLNRREGGTRGWLKIQDGCDRKCSFCATRMARGSSRSRSPSQVLEEARLLARAHPELVLTGIHIGHYGRDLEAPTTLSGLVRLLLEKVPGIRFRLGSVEATEVDDLLLELLENAGGQLAPHLHMPLQSGSDAVLRRMRRWHTREAYRRRVLEVAERLPVLGLGADLIAGFPGETPADHALTRELVEELPFTYLHVFPFSPRDGTPAASLPEPVPQRVAGDRGKELRELGLEKGRAYRSCRLGGRASVVLEGDGGSALTEDYLRVEVFRGPGGSAGTDSPAPASLPPGRGAGILTGRLGGSGDHLTIDLSQGEAGN